MDLKLKVLEGKKPDSAEIQYGLQGTLRSASDGRFKLIQDLAGAPPRRPEPLT